MSPKLLAKILIKDGQSGKYLILRSAEWPENPKRSLKPDLPGGLVEDGETPEIGVLRELKEEAGISLKPDDLKLVDTFEEVHHDKSHKRFIYFAEVVSPAIKLSWEHDMFWWKTAQEILAMEMRDPYPRIFDTMKTKGYLT